MRSRQFYRNLGSLITKRIFSKKREKTKIFVAYHRPCEKLIEDDVYTPIHCGKEISLINLDIPGDNTGDNISSKNGLYSECTGIYWVWKNIKDLNYVGFCQYRRYFGFADRSENTDISTSKETFLRNIRQVELPYPDSIFKKYDIITTHPMSLETSVYDQFSLYHNKKDINIAREVLNTASPGFASGFETKHLYKCNMFIMEWGRFDRFCTWFFDILRQIEGRIDTSSYDTYQQRILGFISERLLHCYIIGTRLQVKSYPCLFIDDI